MVMLQVLLLSLLGWRSWRSLAAPLLYLFFLIPFGEFLVPALQDLVVHFTTAGLRLIGVPNFSDGIVIEIPEGVFLVHQACSGLRFLVASAAFGVLYACVMFRSVTRRTLFAALSLGLAILGNCLRVLGTILIAHFLGNTQAVAADHVLWGWLFYVLIGAALMLSGLPFRQEQHWSTADNVPNGARGTIGAAARALVIIVLLGAIPVYAASTLDEGVGVPPLVTQLQMPTLAGCTTLPPSAAATVPPANGVDNVSAAYRCGDDTYLLTLYRYPARTGVRRLFLGLRAAQTPAGADDVVVQTGDFRLSDTLAAPVWRVTEVGTEDGRFVAAATALWVNGWPVGKGIKARIDQALNTVRQSAMSPVLAVITVYERDARHRAINAFLPKTAQLSDLVRHWVTSP
jgi:exosortase/archaeosortase family protein